MLLLSLSCSYFQEFKRGDYSTDSWIGSQGGGVGKDRTRRYVRTHYGGFWNGNKEENKNKDKNENKKNNKKDFCGDENKN